jgi:hypothetical protein
MLVFSKTCGTSVSEFAQENKILTSSRTKNGETQFGNRR